MIALGIWVVAGVVFFVTDAAPPNSLPMADPISEETGVVVDLVDELLVTTYEVVDENRESVGEAALVMVGAAAVGCLVGLGLFGLAARSPQLWPVRSGILLLGIAILALVWRIGRASIEVWPVDALGSGAVGVTSITTLFLAGLIRGFSGGPQGDSHDEPRVPATA
jgi:hypothetical protein